jgi:PKD domain-containing protein
MARGIAALIRRSTGCLAVVALAVVAPLPAAANGQTAVNPRGRMLGAVEAGGTHAPLHARKAASTTSPLTYHGGPVVHDGHVYAIFWEPPGYSFPLDFKAAVADYFTHVAADSGKRTNVYSVNRQYGDSLGPADYRVAYEASYTDSADLPAGECTNPQASVCLTDAQLTAELGSFIASRQLPTGLTSQYFLFTPPGVGSCYAAGDACAFTDYCAYHSWVDAGGTVLYAIQPYVNGIDTCDMRESPTGTSADAVLNVTSHEHNEIITDPTGAGWFDSDGEENGDKCAWSFGAIQGPGGLRFNQVIAGSPYLLQLEWSNKHGGCVGSLANQGPSAAFVESGHAVPKNALLFDASRSKDLDGTIASYRWAFGDGGAGSGRLALHSYARAGSYQVKLTVTDDEGQVAVQALTVKVLPPATLGNPASHPHGKKHRKHRKKKKRKKKGRRHSAVAYVVARHA